MNKMRDAYFSYQNAERSGFCTYKRKDGKEISVTEVIDVGRKPGSKWEDLQYVGVVIEFISSHKYNTCYEGFWYMKDGLILPSKPEQQPRPERPRLVIVNLVRDVEL